MFPETLITSSIEKKRMKAKYASYKHRITISFGCIHASPLCSLNARLGSIGNTSSKDGVNVTKGSVSGEIIIVHDFTQKTT